MKDIKELANECFSCPNKPCSQGCPVRTNIPEFIQEIKNDNINKAYVILHKNNLFSHICSLVCPQEKQCEGSCIRNAKFGATHIGELEKFVNEKAIEKGIKFDVEKKANNGKKVAVIGSGPAGLECAYELLLQGFSVDIYEKENEIGGLLVYGIPDFRLDRKIVENIIDIIKNLGANFYLENELGKDIFLENIRKNYDFVFLGIGAPKSSMYSLNTNKSNSIFDSNIFLKKYNRGEYISNLGKVVVIGGGNVAMDCARAAVRMGAEEVKILYRRDKSHMPARIIELEDAINDGVIFKELVRVESANDNNEIITSVNCVETEIINGKAVDKENGRIWKEEANTIVFAIGLKPDKALLESQGLELDDWGYLKLDENGKTNFENVYAAGDVNDNNAYVCRAIAGAKKAAVAIASKVL